MDVSDFVKDLNRDDMKQHLYLAVYDALYQGVKDQKAGEKLPTEEEFAAYWGISRGTVREAMYHLQEDGFITKEQGRRSAVAHSGADGMPFSFQANGNPVLSVYDVDDIAPRPLLACSSNWLSTRLDLASGSPVVGVVTDYLSGGSRVATSYYLFAFSLLEEMGLAWEDTEGWKELVRSRLYDRATTVHSSLSLLKGPIQDRELGQVTTPTLLDEEFLFSHDRCFAFTRNYFDQGNPRIRILRK
jgi:hypothetical protein